MANQGANGAANVEKLITMYGSKGHAVGDSLTWADLLIFDIASALFAKDPSFKEHYPKLLEVHDTVAAHPRIAEYVKNRPVTPF
jgi:prostaglandin-H2 D-isomerase / glutathione transferase